MHASPMDSPTSIRKTSPYEGPFQRGKRPDVVGVTFRQESTLCGPQDKARQSLVRIYSKLIECQA